MTNTSVTVPILTARASRINDAHSRSVAAGKTMLNWAIEAGKELLEVKKGLPHGAFQPWCAENLTFAQSTAREYMRAAKAGKTMDLHHFEGGLRSLLDAAATSKASAQSPVLTPDDAQRLQKLARMANGGNEHEEAVAQEMLDKMASRFGMTGEEAQAAADKLCPEAPTAADMNAKADEFNSRISGRLNAIRDEVASLILNAPTTDAAIDQLSKIICVLKYPKEFTDA